MCRDIMSGAVLFSSMTMLCHVKDSTLYDYGISIIDPSDYPISILPYVCIFHMVTSLASILPYVRLY